MCALGVIWEAENRSFCMNDKYRESDYYLACLIIHLQAVCDGNCSDTTYVKLVTLR